MTGLNEQTAAARGHFQQAQVHPVLSHLRIQKYLTLHGFPLENAMWNWKPSRAVHFSPNKCILANSSIKSFCIMPQPNNDQLKELTQATGSM